MNTWRCTRSIGRDAGDTFFHLQDVNGTVEKGLGVERAATGTFWLTSSRSLSPAAGVYLWRFRVGMDQEECADFAGGIIRAINT